MFVEVFPHNFAKFKDPIKLLKFSLSQKPFKKQMGPTFESLGN